jgi:hypothetical protein
MLSKSLELSVELQSRAMNLYRTHHAIKKQACPLRRLVGLFHITLGPHMLQKGCLKSIKVTVHIIPSSGQFYTNVPISDDKILMRDGDLDLQNASKSCTVHVDLGMFSLFILMKHISITWSRLKEVTKGILSTSLKSI